MLSFFLRARYVPQISVLTTDRPTCLRGKAAFLEELQMAISHQPIVRFTFGLVLGWSYRGRPI